MKPDRAFSSLVGRIYDCALDMNLWTNVLGEITEAVDGAMANVISADPLRGQQTYLLSWNLPDDLAALVLENASLNPTLPFGLTMPLCEPTTASRHIDLEAFHRSRYWTTCFAGRGYYDCVAAPLTRTVSTFTAIGIFGDEAKGAYTDDDIEVARLLMPHIKRSLEIAGVLGRQRVEVDTLHAALDALNDVALIIGPDNVILFGNEAANEELARARILRRYENRLLGVTREAVDLLETLSAVEGRMRHRGLEARLSDNTGRARYDGRRDARHRALDGEEPPRRHLRQDRDEPAERTGEARDEPQLTASAMSEASGACAARASASASRRRTSRASRTSRTPCDSSARQVFTAYSRFAPRCPRHRCSLRRISSSASRT